MQVLAVSQSCLIWKVSLGSAELEWFTRIFRFSQVRNLIEGASSECNPEEVRMKGSVYVELLFAVVYPLL